MLPPFLAPLFTKFGAYLIMALAALGAVTAVLAGARTAGRNAQRVEDAKRTVEAVNARQEVDTRVDAASDAERERLRRKWSS